MATNARNNLLALEDLRSQMNQLQGDLEKVAKEGSDRSDYLASTLKTQTDLLNQKFDDRLGKLESLLEGVLKSKPLDHVPLTLPSQAGVLGPQPPHIPTSAHDNSGTLVKQHSDKFSLPKADFPVFDGTDPWDWLMKCNCYFDLYQVPHVHKSRLAVLHFAGNASVWYRNLRADGVCPTWEVLLEEIFARFNIDTGQDVIGEFKRLQQDGKVSDYITSFDQLKAKLQLAQPYLPATYFVSSFVEGLREDIRSMVSIFKPQSLNEAYTCAVKYESAMEFNNRRFKVTAKIPSFSPTPNTKPYQSQHKRTDSFESKKGSNSCFKCGDRWFPGHHCKTKQIHLVELASDEEES